MSRRYADHLGYGLRATGYGSEARRALAACCVCFSLLGLAACGSTPTAPEEQAEPVTGAASSTPPSESAAQTTAARSAKSAKPAANVPAQPAVPEAPIPPEAMQQFSDAVTLMGSGNTAGAEQAFRSLSAAYPTYSGALLNLGILQVKTGKLEDAEKTLKSAIERNAANAAAFNQLGIVYRRLGRFQEADEAYQRALQIDPEYALAHLNLGVLCDLYLQQPQRALEAYEKYLALATTPDAKVNGWVAELKARLGSDPRSARTGS